MKNYLEIIKEKLNSGGKFWIGFVGDSITSTEWVHPNWREIVEYVLKDKFDYDWGIKTFNLAYDGATSRDLVKIINNYELLITNEKIRMDMVILMTGANDPFHGEITPGELKENIIEIKKLVEMSGVDFVLSSDNCPMNQWAEEKCVPYVEALNSMEGNSVKLFEESKNFPIERIYTFKSEQDIPEERVKKGEVDFWHPNQLGNAYIAKVILDKVFGIGFDPEKFMKETWAGEKIPRY
ncbi:SGNH/GDSL hydrolase family protein [Candidatus Shapirobacteria bacterium]|nr:SGNH/GDSL hydrolase family protein [Candidatus Shapirobacteria bacterium]